MESETQHPALDRPPMEYITSWERWMHLWERTNALELLVSLLHYGFAVRCGSRKEFVERVKFYLALADNHMFLNGPPRNCVVIQGPLTDNLNYLPRVLAEKAFGVFCEVVLKPIVQGDARAQERHYRLLLCEPELLEAVLHFFRLEAEIRNLPYGAKHAKHGVASIAYKALCLIAVAPWRSPYEGQLSEKHAAFVDLLYGLDMLDELPLRMGDHFECDECEEELKKLSLSTKVYVVDQGYRNVTTIGEALLAGSGAAQKLIVMQALREARAAGIRFR